MAVSDSSEVRRARGAARTGVRGLVAGEPSESLAERSHGLRLPCNSDAAKAYVQLRRCKMRK